jgi:aryl-alcohol dehydrogenase-like predicted oxidoreductase/predicted kinase/histidinol phosphatase-like enzyme
MRLSTDPDRDEVRGLAVLHAAFDAGLTFLDTADAYCLDDTEGGHNERLIARALAGWKGDRSRMVVATKGGMTRPGGRWEADGRATHLAAACEASCRALDVARIDLYQLHAPDPRVPLATSVRALAALQRDGLVERIGLCNVTVGQIEDARRIAEIDAVQVELSVWQDESLLNGVVEFCMNQRILLLAHRPLGGPRRLRRTLTDSTLTEIAERRGASPAAIALAWLISLSDRIVPLPGATRVETAGSIARVPLVTLTDEDRAQLERRFPSSRALRRPAGPPVVASRSDAEAVLVMGLPGAGKSTYAEALAAEGFLRLNRDEAGGTLRDLLPALDAALTSGSPRVVLDNTYVTRKSRGEVIQAAAARGVPVRCIWLKTSVEDAQVNAASRIVSRYGKLPDEAELKALRRHDAAAMLPSVQFRYQRELEPPDLSEGFSRIDTIDFERRFDPSFVNRAVIVWCDGVLLRSRPDRRVPLSPGEVDVFAERGATLRRYRDEGFHLLGISWQPEIADGAQSRAGADAVFARMRELLQVDIDVEYCPHAAGPPSCWCRKPLPGLGVLFIHRHRLDPRQCIYVGSGPQDAGFARRLGFVYSEVDEFFPA